MLLEGVLSHDVYTAVTLKEKKEDLMPTLKPIAV